MLKPLLHTLEVEDPITGWAARQVRHYESPVSLYGRLLGFEHIEVDEYGWEPDYAVMSGPIEALDWQLLGTTETDYLLTDYWSLPESRCVWAYEDSSPLAC